MPKYTAFAQVHAIYLESILHFTYKHTLECPISNQMHQEELREMGVLVYGGMFE